MLASLSYRSVGDVIGANWPHLPERGVNIGSGSSQVSAIISPSGTAAGERMFLLIRTLAQTAFMRYLLRRDA
jgi:hypothetical protein